MNPTYVIMTAARNEAAQIRHCLDAVVAQTIKPLRWIIVSDSSTDDTDRIVTEYAVRHPFIRLIRRERTGGRTFSGKAAALSDAREALRDLTPDFIVAMDADCSFKPDFFHQTLAKFEEDDRLGVAGGLVYEYRKGELITLKNHEENVSGLMQVFRRRCFEEVGGYLCGIPGNIDSVAVVTARMRGWRTRAFRDLPIMHHRTEGTGEGSLYKARFNYGYRDHFMGYHPLFFLAMTVGRITEYPYLIGSMLRIAGFAWGAVRNMGRPRPLSAEFVKYLRQEQMRRLREVFVPSS